MYGIYACNITKLPRAQVTQKTTHLTGKKKTRYISSSRETIARSTPEVDLGKWQLSFARQELIVTEG